MRGAIPYLGSVHYLWGRGAGKWEEGQAKFIPLFRGGGGGRFYSGSGKEGRGDKKV